MPSFVDKMLREFDSKSVESFHPVEIVSELHYKTSDGHVVSEFTIVNVHSLASDTVSATELYHLRDVVFAIEQQADVDGAIETLLSLDRGYDLYFKFID
jgi:hypothetical protein